MKKLLIAALLLFAVPAAADPVISLGAGVNAIWFDGPNGPPADFEAGANAAASLSPHLSLVGAAYYGFDHSYFRGSLGGRATITDADNEYFSIGIGIQRHFSTDPEIRAEEWAPDVSIGWTPFPTTQPRWVVIAQGGYGLETNRASLLAGVRYAIGRWE